MEDKVVVVIGGTSGVGLSAVRHFASQGAAVVFDGRSAVKGIAEEKHAKEAGYRVVFLKGDVTEKKDVSELFNAAEKKFGGIDILINCASSAGSKAFVEDLDEKDMRKVMEVNFFAVFTCIQLIVPYFKKRGGGTIFNISSDSSIDPSAGFSPFCCSKSALNMLTSVAALDLAKSNVKLYALMLLVFETDSSEITAKTLGLADAKALAAAYNPSKKIGKGSEVAEFMVDIMAGKTKYGSGDAILLDAGKQAYSLHEAVELLAHQKSGSKLIGSMKSSVLCSFSRRDDLKKELKESKDKKRI